MAVILDQITIGEQRIVVLDSAPNTGGGFSGEIGDLAIVSGQVGIYQKGNTGNTDWSLSSVDPEQVMDIVSAAMVDTSTIAFTYNDPAGTLEAALKALSVTDSHIAAAAGIALSKLASVSANKVLVSDGSGVISASSVSTTTLGYLDATSSIQTQLDSKIASSEKGANNGVATLDAGGKVPVSQLPNSVMEFQGFFNPNTTTLADGSGNPGDVYEADTAGSHDFGNGSISFNIGDWAVYAADGKYHKSLNSNEVTSVNGQTGTVVLTTDNVSEGSTNLYFTNSRAKSAAVADAIVDGVTDVAPSQNAVFDALALKADSADLTNHLNDTVDAHDASAISNIPSGNLAATDVQAALNELQSDIDTRALDSAVVKKDGSVAMEANLDLGSNKLINVANPTALTDAVNRDFAGGYGVLSITTDTYGGTYTLTSTAERTIIVSLSTAFTIKLMASPVKGDVVVIKNTSSGVITVQDNAGGSISSGVVQPGSYGTFKYSGTAWGATTSLYRQASTSTYSLASNRIINLGAPTAGTSDAATALYAETVANAKVSDAIVDGVTTVAPSQNAVFDALALKQDLSEKGQANGYASLDATGKVPAAQLPSSVDDVLEYANLASFPVSGSTGIIYVALDTNKTYRWSGSAYIEISPSEVISVNTKTGVVTLVAGDIGITAISGVTGSEVQTALESLKTQIDGKSAIGHTHTSADITDFTEAAQDAVGAALTDSATIDFTYTDGSNQISASVIQSAISHSNIGDLLNDDHTQYVLLAGRSGGQIVKGDTASAGNLELQSTANATKGKILFGSAAAIDEANSRLGVGTVSPVSVVDVIENNVRYGLRGTSTSTSGSVNAVVSSITPANDSVEIIKVFVTGIDLNFDSVAYERTVKVKNVGGTVSLATIQSDYTAEDAVLSTANCTFIVNGNAVDVRVTGVNAKTITWKCVLQRVR